MKSVPNCAEDGSAVDIDHLKSANIPVVHVMNGWMPIMLLGVIFPQTN